jgi:hypothetical protein
MNPLIKFKKAPPLFVITFALGCLALSTAVQAVSPAPDGGYPGGNTAEGQNALFSLTAGGFNTAVGLFSLRSSTTNSFNTAVGAGTLFVNTADENTATGAGALLSNTTGYNNTADGAFTLFSNTLGIQNTAIGITALFSNTTGSNNTAIGISALDSNTTGSGNTATGYKALVNNTTANGNTAIGASALLGNTTGSDNTALGVNAASLTTTGSSNIYIGDVGAGAESNTIAIGNVPASGTSYNQFFVGAVYGVTANGTTLPVIINKAGQLGTTPSAARFKKQIKPMDKASESVLALKPVTFQYKSDKSGTPQFGLVAEDVARVNPDLVVRDNNGEIYTVRYEAVNAMLLNEFLKAHQRIEEQDKRIEQLTAQLKEQALLIQKVNDKVELNRAAPQAVLNSQ